MSLIFIACVQSVCAQWSPEGSMGYSFAAPSGSMMNYIKQGNGIVLDFHMISPNQRFSLGADLNYTIYGFDQSRQQYMFPDGTMAEMDINVTNSFVNLMASGRYNLIIGKKLIPYVGVKAGYSFYRTDLTIYDPDDFDSCHPVETDLLKKDGTFIYSIGGGFKYDVANVFKKMRKEFFYINVSAFYTQGGNVSYMSTDAPMAHSSSSATGNRQDVEAAFLNTQTQVVHKHHVGYVYSSYAQMMDFRISLLLRSGR